MNRIVAAFAGGLLVVGQGLGPAAAQTVNKTWVSSQGVDTGVCTVAAPCRTFQYAIDTTNPGGEVDVKDSGSFGQLHITKAISIINKGNLATVSVPQGGFGVMVEGTTLNDRIVLRGLTIDGHGSGGVGITYQTRGKLLIDDCIIENLSTGITAELLDSVSIFNSKILFSEQTGIGIQNIVGAAALSGVTLAGNQNIALYVTSSTVLISHSEFIQNVNAIYGSFGKLLLDDDNIQLNAGGVQIVGGTVSSYGNNGIDFNDTNVIGTLTPVARR